MAITAIIDLSGSICVKDGCTKLTFSDTTGFKVTECTCDQNDNGYGLTGGIALNDVTSAVLNAYYPEMDTAYKFTFTIVNHVITAATLTDINGIVTNIYADLVSTVFPLTDFEITLPAYGVTFPKLTDGIINWDYTIDGVSGATPFSYTTSDGTLSDCNINCCIEKSYLDLDTSCGCLNDKIKKIINSEIFLNAANYAISVGQESKTNEFVALANQFCESNCKDC